MSTDDKAQIQAAANRAHVREQLDSIVNVLSGSGTDRAKTTWNQFKDLRPLDMATLEALYANNALAKAIVDRLVDDSLREGFLLERAEPIESDEQDAEAILKRWEELQEEESRFMRGAKWGRLFGGGGLILGVRDGNDLASELNDANVTKVEFIKDVDRQQLNAVSWYVDGRPMMYDYQPVLQGAPENVNPGPIKVHASRVMLFPGASTTAERRRENQGWDLSVLQAVYEVLLSYEAMWDSIDNQLADASQAVFKLSGLIQSLAEDGGREDVRTRLALMDMGRSAARAIVLDAGNDAGEGKEEFEVVERSGLGGLDKVQQNYFTRISAAAETPESILLGTAPGGDSATGDLERAMWFGRCDYRRRHVDEPRILRIVRMLSRELKQENPDSWKIVWPELEKMSPMDAQTTAKMAVDSAVALVAAQAVLPEEVALGIRRLPALKWLKIDPEARLQALEAAQEEIASRTLGLEMMEEEAKIEAKHAPKPAPGAKPTPTTSKRKTVSKASGGARQG